METERMPTLEQLIQRVEHVQHGFAEIHTAADEVIRSSSTSENLLLAKQLFSSQVHQARMLATFIFGHLAGANQESFTFLYERVSRDPDWRVQEILAQAFDRYCKTVGYEPALPIITQWLGDDNLNVRRAVTEGLRIWTARPYFRENPETAIRLLSRLKDDSSDYVRKSVGNALRDISRKHATLVRAELQHWDTADKKVVQTYKLAAKFLEIPR